ncbi:sulfatase [Coraliomargarita algicola]|uniref:Sulfatase n=1 Tax=Coraliomargarita algicola TaxID=3092156 RepID=A0ABZ0RNN0_9BACT|nr:sulfatase [Coraliomargarita sp. J2-16]WPJ97023.1 sulfatase [Coraliomargarita sp. J2-16]
MKNKFNIVYIHSHDTGRHIQPYGYAVDTPRLQQLAEEGIMFRKAFDAAPVCSASRAALLTGMCPHSNGMMGLAHFGWRLNDYKQHIIHTLHKAGYVSALSGIQHIAARPASSVEEIGYSEVLATDSKKADDITNAALEYLGREHEQPFFLSVGYFDTHRPFPTEIDERDDPKYTLVPPTLIDSPENREDMAAYKTSARTWDTSVGRVLDALEANGQAENTLVICTTDHGLAMPKMKCKLTDHGTGVLLIMRGPGGFEGGRVIDGMISHIDLFPTICELLEIEKPDWLQGTSIMPLIQGEAVEVNEELFAEVTYHAAYEPKRSVRTKRWKYIRRFDQEYTKEVRPNCDDGPGKFLMLDGGWGELEPDVEQLYDLLLDPQEYNNLADKTAYAEVLDQMRARLDRWMERTNDPLLNGPVPPSEHFKTWPITNVSPKGPMFDKNGNEILPDNFLQNAR